MYSNDSLIIDYVKFLTAEALKKKQHRFPAPPLHRITGLSPLHRITEQTFYFHAKKIPLFLGGFSVEIEKNLLYITCDTVIAIGVECWVGGLKIL